jgi:hypothetical protein
MESCWNDNYCREISSPRLNDKPIPKKEGKESISTKKDFSSFSAGASIIERLTSPTWSYRRKIRSSKLPFFEKLEKVSGSPPITILLSDLSLGTCWPFHGSTGNVEI